MSDAQRRSILANKNNHNSYGQSSPVSSTLTMIHPSPLENVQSSLHQHQYQQYQQQLQAARQQNQNDHNKLINENGVSVNQITADDVIVGTPMPGLVNSNTYQQQAQPQPQYGLGGGHEAAALYYHTTPGPVQQIQLGGPGVNANPIQQLQGYNNNNNYMSNQLRIIGANCYSVVGTAIKLIGPATQCPTGITPTIRITNEQQKKTLKSLMAKLAQVLPPGAPNEPDNKNKKKKNEPSSIWESALESIESIPILGQLLKDNTAAASSK